MNRILVCGMAAAVGWAGSLAGAAALPFPQHVEYAPGSLLPTLRTRAQLDQDVLNGIPLAGSDYYSTFFVAPLGVGAMASSNLPAWLNAVYSNVYRGSSGYYEDSVTLLCLLVMSGNYWDPTTTVPEPAAGLAVMLVAAYVAVSRRSCRTATDH